MKISRRGFFGSLSLPNNAVLRGGYSKPNIVLVLADDLGYGDVGYNGAPFPTPNLDKIKEEGVCFSSCTSPDSVCTPSRVALLTGMYPARTGLTYVLSPQDTAGLSPSVPTISSVMKAAGYKTACFGKWHLGRNREYSPLRHGFDEFFGLPYSNDMDPKILMEGDDLWGQDFDNASLTRLIANRGVRFINKAAGSPFFLYLPFTSPHIPLSTVTRSKFGPYADTVMEFDSACGEIMKALEESGVSNNTLTIVTSDNGPWYQGSTGIFRGRKGEAYEGGHRVPFVCRWPSLLEPSQVVDTPISLVDVMPSLVEAVGASAGKSDGRSIWNILQREMLDERVFLYFNGAHIHAARLGKWKMHFARLTKDPWTYLPGASIETLRLWRPELFNLESDPGENYDLFDSNLEIADLILKATVSAVETLPKPYQEIWGAMLATEVDRHPSGARPVSS